MKRFSFGLWALVHVSTLLSHSVCAKKMKKRRRVRALDLLGKDQFLLQAIADPKFSVSGLTHRDLREILQDTAGFRGKTSKQQSAKVSRLIRLLRDHGLLYKYPR